MALGMDTYCLVTADRGRIWGQARWLLNDTASSLKTSSPACSSLSTPNGRATIGGLSCTTATRSCCRDWTSYAVDRPGADMTRRTEGAL
jgi:hypothetical protein